jgi:hypothetical protein
MSNAFLENISISFLFEEKLGWIPSPFHQKFKMGQGEGNMPG